MRFSNHFDGHGLQLNHLPRQRTTGTFLSMAETRIRAIRQSMFNMGMLQGIGLNPFSSSIYYQPLQPFPFTDDFSTEKGWFGYESGGWERGSAKAGGGENGYPDPGIDYSPSDDNYILGFAIGADYPNDLAEKSIISPPIDCTGQDKVFLKFRRYLNVEGNEYDHAKIYVSVMGQIGLKSGRILQLI